MATANFIIPSFDGDCTLVNSSVRPVIVGSWGPPVLACVRSWGRRGFRTGVVAIQEKDELPPKSLFIDSCLVLPRPLVGTQRGLERIGDFLKHFRPTGIMAVEESVAMWLQQGSGFFGRGVVFWGPPPLVVDRLLDKRIQVHAALKVGLPVLPTAILESPFDSLSPVKDGDYPLCVRPARPGMKPPFKVKLTWSQTELRRWLRSLGTFSVPLIVQPFKNLPNLVVHGSRDSEGYPLGLQAFLVPRKFQGLTLTLEPMVLQPCLEKKCQAFLEELRVVGPFHFEFLWDPSEGKAWFLEINNRLGGTTAKVLACGYDEPAYALKAFGIPVPGLENPRPLRPVRASSRQALIKYAAFALTGRLTPLDFPRESAVRNFAAALGCFLSCRDDVWAWDDIPGSLSLYGTNILGKLPKGVRFGLRGWRRSGSRKDVHDSSR